ncbi:GMC family oxidoreductase N-terminal domain-containing protein [Arthrobacter globiformis]|uniref:lycopene cyclase family protein n=1 Tax=Arthrobacter globiformis TaxID=1665 RepID=UPI003979B644
MNTTENTFDYIIVGGGSAGATMARKLADDPHVSVCLIEGGPAYEDDPKVRSGLGMRDPAGYPFEGQVASCPKVSGFTGCCFLGRFSTTRR